TTIALIAMVAGRLATHAYAWWRAKTPKIRSGGAKIKPLLSYGIRAMPGSLSDLANNRLDQLLIVPFVGLRQLGFYAVAVGINFIPVQLGNAMASGTFARVRPT